MLDFNQQGQKSSKHGYDLKLANKLFGGVDTFPLCSRCCSQVEDITIVHWVGVGLSQLSLVFASNIVINILTVMSANDTFHHLMY